MYIADTFFTTSIKTLGNLAIDNSPYLSNPIEKARQHPHEGNT
jgi:hypothetical protein